MQLTINGPTPLTGAVAVGTSKNAALPILAATLLTEESITLHQLPQIADVQVILELLREIGARTETCQNTLHINGTIANPCPSGKQVRRIRGSFLLLGPLLARKKKVRLSLPGGCAIGSRPVDLHLKGLRQLGASIQLENGDIIAQAPRLTGSRIYLDFPSVGATENIMMAAALAEGDTYIENAALEPEITDLAHFINAMGGHIRGAGSSRIHITGVPELHAAAYTPIPDRIEAGTLLTAIAASHGEGMVENIIPAHIKAITAKLRESGAEIEEEKNRIFIKAPSHIHPIYVKTLPYPGFPTDMQAQIMAYLMGCAGSSIISETVFENRYQHAAELQRMGGDIRIEGRTAIIRGQKIFSGAVVRATDLRAGAALLIASLFAEGTTTLLDCEHITRGYESLPEKLNALGAAIIPG